MLNIPTELLRSFVAVTDSGGVSRAGNLVGRSQPAVSLQIRRLESLVGTPLFLRQSRQFMLTESGQVLLAYARSILRLNDEVVARLQASGVSGVVRLGVPNEYADSFLPTILGKFARAYPDVALEVGCELSTHLVAKLERGEYDLVFGLHIAANEQLPAQGWAESLVWVAGPDLSLVDQADIPLIVAPEGCVYRQQMLATLASTGQTWRIAYTSPSFGGIKAGVLAGLGVTVLARRTVPEGWRILGLAENLPPLPDIRVHLHYAKTNTSDAVLALAAYMSARLAEGAV